MTSIGIMQGRLVPPVGGEIQAFPLDHWRDEFPLAAQAGLDAIEWIYDLPDARVNPLATDAGIAEIHALSSAHRVAVRSVCADYFMRRPLVRASPAERADRLATLAWLLERCHACDITRMVLPFVDASKIESETDRDEVVAALEHVAGVMERTGVEIHLETSLSPVEFSRLLDRLPNRMVQVNYDSGNSASLGHDPHAELEAYGNRIGSVHIKDRILGGGTTLLGTGNAKFPALFAGLRAIGYAGPWVLQAVRGKPGDEVNRLRGTTVRFWRNISWGGGRRMDLALANRVAFVAGSSRGIGKAIAAAFLAEGCRTVVTGRDAAALAQRAANWSRNMAATGSWSMRAIWRMPRRFATPSRPSGGVGGGSTSWWPTSAVVEGRPAGGRPPTTGRGCSRLTSGPRSGSWRRSCPR